MSATVVTLPDYELVTVDGPLRDFRDMLFTCAEGWFEIVVDGQPRVAVNYGWQYTAALLSPIDVDVLPPWDPDDVESTRPPDVGLDREEAAQVATDRLDRLRRLPWTQLLAMPHQRVEHVGPSGVVDRMDVDVCWDAPLLERLRRRGDATVQVTVHTDGLSVIFQSSPPSRSPPTEASVSHDRNRETCEITGAAWGRVLAW